MTRIRTLDDLNVVGRTVLVRGDLDVPITDGKITDTALIDHLAPTLIELAQKGAKILILAHLGVPNGTPDSSASLRQVLPDLERAVGRPVLFAQDCIGPRAKLAAAMTRPGDIILLENLRFHDGEEENNQTFAKRLAELGDIFINDAFTCSHLQHASIIALASLLPSAAGRGMQAKLTTSPDFETLPGVAALRQRVV